MRYVAFIHKDPGSDYGVLFPDLPGCFSAGSTMDETLRNAVEALASHVSWLETDGDAVPRPRDLDVIASDPELAEDREGAVMVAIPLLRERGLATRVSLDLDAGLVEAIDTAARERGQTRSEFLASAARLMLAG